MRGKSPGKRTSMSSTCVTPTISTPTTALAQSTPMESSSPAPEPRYITLRKERMAEAARKAEAAREAAAEEESNGGGGGVAAVGKRAKRRLKEAAKQEAAVGSARNGQ